MFGIFSKKSAKSPQASRARRRTILEVENLESRLVPASVIPSPTDAVGATLAAPAPMSWVPITDMTQLAAQFPRHAGATALYLNFDGQTDVAPFQSVTGNRVADIHEILYRVQEFFAPVDVTVQQIQGYNTYATSGGATTIFIGDNVTYGQGVANSVGGRSPGDYPHAYVGYTHVPNSNPYDVGYVDPVFFKNGQTLTNSLASISQTIGHEAAHSFGLAHVLASPDDEIMSYNSYMTHFNNKAFGITDLNGSTSNPLLLPKWTQKVGLFDVTVPITSQNSYTYLRTALGARVIGNDFANIADSRTVDPTYTDGAKWNVLLGSSVISSIDRAGDFDVFAFTAPETQTISIRVDRYGGSQVDPVLIVYDDNAYVRISFNDDFGSVNSRIDVQVSQGSKYQFVVGGYASSSIGAYAISINPYVFNKNDIALSAMTPVKPLGVSSSPMTFSAMANTNLLATNDTYLRASTASSGLTTTEATKKKAPLVATASRSLIAATAKFAKPVTGLATWESVVAAVIAEGL